MKIKDKLLLVILWFSLAFIAWNFSYAKDYEYKSLNIQANVSIDWTIDVRETFTTNFLERRHWIIRNIPLSYSVEWGKFYIDISNVGVEWSKFTTSKTDWEFEIKIWDAGKTVIWEQIYPISYSAYWLIRNFSWMWFAELYWNIVWCDFDTNVNFIRAELFLPKNHTGFTNDDFLITVDWKESSVWTFDWKLDWSKWDRITITYDKTLSPWDGITLAIKFPNNYFEFDNSKQANLLWNVNKLKHISFNSTTKALFLVFWVIIFLFILMYISNNFLNKKIKPIKWGIYPMMVEYAPPKWINSAEAWLLFNCRVDPVDMTSLFYQWVNNGLMRINYDKYNTGPNSKKIKSVTLIKIKDIPESYPYYERDLFNGIFKEGKKSVYIDKNTNLSKILSILWLEHFWFKKHWLCRRKISTILWIIFLSLAAALLVLWIYYFKKLWILFFVLLVLFLVFFLPLFSGVAFKQDDKIRLTKEWKKIANCVIWYAEFIKKCDENVLKMLLEEDPLYIDKTLPYAVAFGMETEFIKKVTPLLKDIEKTWLKWNSDIMFPVLDTISFMKKIVFNSKQNKALLNLGIRSLYWLWNNKKSNSSYSGWNFHYSDLKWFDIWSVFSWWWKLFKKWWWGWWWGSKSW